MVKLDAIDLTFICSLGVMRGLRVHDSMVVFATPCATFCYLFLDQLILPGVSKGLLDIDNMRQVQPETLLKNSNFSSCLQNIKLKNNTYVIGK
jgi:hypothetical protein